MISDRWPPKPQVTSSSRKVIWTKVRESWRKEQKQKLFCLWETVNHQTLQIEWPCGEHQNVFSESIMNRSQKAPRHPSVDPSGETRQLGWWEPNRLGSLEYNSVWWCQHRQHPPPLPGAILPRCSSSPSLRPTLSQDYSTHGHTLANVGFHSVT